MLLPEISERNPKFRFRGISDLGSGISGSGVMSLQVGCRVLMLKALRDA